MKNQILNIGKALNKAEQKLITGGLKSLEEAACLSAGSYCRSDAYQKCCGTCKLISGRNGTCK